MKRIPLKSRNGIIKAYALVDDIDYVTLRCFNWHLTADGYAARSINSYPFKMHREILGLKRGDQNLTDHINRNKLDNQRENLRVVGIKVNNQNVSGYGKSKYRGVSWDKKNKKWQTHVKLNGKSIALGRFDDEHEAAKVASEFRKKHMPGSIEEGE